MGADINNRCQQNSLNLVIRSETLEYRPNGPASGIVFWQIEGTCFPDAQWYDFAVVLFTWWLPAVGRLLNRSSESETLDFMDGPYCVVCTLTGSDRVECDFLKRGSPDITHHWQGPITILADTVLATAREVLRRGDMNDATGQDVTNLRRAVQAANGWL